MTITNDGCFLNMRNHMVCMQWRSMGLHVLNPSQEWDCGFNIWSHITKTLSLDYPSV